MAPDDRDRTFEKALARHLRPSSRADADLRGDAANESCPDPETLAAYHERSLSLQELNSWKQHIAGCERCQLVLAHLETTEDIPLGVDAKENVLAMNEPIFGQSPVRERSEAMSVARRLELPRSVLEKAAAPAPAVKQLPRRTQWRWLAPAGALAAGLLAWVALHETQPARLTTQPPVQEAQNREPTPPPEPVVTAPATKANEDQRARRPELTAGLRDDAKKIVPQTRSQQLGRETASASIPKVELDSKKKDSEEKTERVVAADAQAADKSKAQVADELSGQPENERQTAVQQNAPAASQPAFVSTEASAAPAAPAPSSHAKQSQTAVESKSAAVGGAVSSGADNKISSNLQSMKPFHLAKTPSSRIVSAPGDKLLWLLGSAGVISVSTDNGANWTPQSSGVTAELLAGSAPTEQVCWIVGSSGTILRTTDGGAHWFKQNSPLTSDLFSIRATDALRARIWSVPDAQSRSMKSYQTSDGGVTWTQVPNP